MELDSSPVPGEGAIGVFADPESLFVSDDPLFALPAPAGPQTRALLPTNDASGEGMIDQAFADVFGQLLHGDLTPEQAVAGWEQAAQAHADELREKASLNLHSNLKHLHLNHLADDLEAEASTWRLVQHLFCYVAEGQSAGGQGGPAALGCGKYHTLRHVVADLVSEDPELQRCARVVAWLESLVADQIDREEGTFSAASARFAENQGLCRETRSRLESASIAGGRGGDTGLVSELDPDACSRQGKTLHPDNVADQERLLAGVWRLLRAGRVAAAQELCRRCGQWWRASTLTGGDGFGQVPVGEAAARLDAAPTEEQVDGVWGEVEAQLGLAWGGQEVGRALWKWSCLQCAHRLQREAGAAAHVGQSNALEAAVYGLLAGDAGSVIPQCSSWEAACWGYYRCWMESYVDQRLQACRSIVHQDMDQDLYQLSMAAIRGGDAGPEEAAPRCDPQVLQGGLDVPRGGWPPPDLHAQLPLLTEVFGQLRESGVKDIRQAASHPHHIIQEHLVQHDAANGLPALWEALTRWLSGPHPSPHLKRFGAHLALALRHLGALPEDGSTYNLHTNALNELVHEHVVQLVEAGRVQAAPMYATAQRAHLRCDDFVRVFEHLTDAAADGSGDDVCPVAFEAARYWFNFGEAAAAAASADAAAGPPPQPPLGGEINAVVAAVADSMRWSTRGGPTRRVAAVQWLSYAYDAVAASADGLPLTVGAPPPSPAASTEAAQLMQHCSHMCRELSLQDDTGWAQGLQLLAAHLPQQLLDAQPAEGTALLQAELREWKQYFELQASFEEWSAALAGLASQSRATPLGASAAPTATPAAMQTHLEQGLALGEALLRGSCEFMSEVLQGLRARERGEGASSNLVLLAAHFWEPQGGDPQQGPGYAPFTEEELQELGEQLAGPGHQVAAAGGCTLSAVALSPEAALPVMGSVSAALQAAIQERRLTEAMAGSMCLELHPHPGAAHSLGWPDPEAGLVSTAAGLIRGAPDRPPLSAVNMCVLAAHPERAPRPRESIAIRLCRSLCVPRLVLQAAEVRLGLVQLGGAGDALGARLMSIAADPELRIADELMSREQVQQLLRWEHQAVVEGLLAAEAPLRSDAGLDTPSDPETVAAPDVTL